MNIQACRSVGAPRGSVVAFNSSKPNLRATYPVRGTKPHTAKKAGYYGENAPDSFYNREVEEGRQMRDQHDGVVMASRNDYLGATKNDDRYRLDAASNTVMNEMNNISPLSMREKRDSQAPLVNLNVARRVGILLKMVSSVRALIPENGETCVASPSSSVGGSPRYKSALERVSQMTSESRRGVAN